MSSNLGIDGLISGLNTSELIQAILDTQVRAPVEQISTRIDTEKEKLTALQTVSANLLSLQIANSSLKSSYLFDSKTIKSSNENIVSVSASSSASTGYFSLKVNNLAKSDQISSDVFDSRSDELKLAGKFIINGETIDISSDDSLNTIATQINAANAGVKASVVQLSPNQNKLILGATSTGVNKIEMREVGTSNVLSDLGLITSDSSELNYDRTVNANNKGALSDKRTVGFTQTYTGETFTVSDAGGQFDLSVSLSGANMTLQDIADQINQASTTAGANISASVIDDTGSQRLVITSSTGIPQKFTDPDNVLFNLGVIGGIQSAAFSSTSSAVGTLMDLGSTSASTITLEDGDGSDSVSLSIDLDTDSLTNIVNRINTAASAAGSDITAKIITADGVSRLELNSSTGKVNITADSQNVMQTLGIADRQFNHIDQTGENSQLTYNGVTVNRSSNLVTDLEDGVSISLVNESSETVNVSVTQDLSNVEETLQTFVDSYNTLANLLSEQTYYDSDTQTKGVLFGNSTIRDLQSALAGGISRSISNMPGVKVSALNDGGGIDLGKITITDRKGTATTVDLTGVSSVQDVLDTINSTKGILVSAEINSNGTGINLVDKSGGTGVFKVEEVNGGTTAADLGLKKQIYSSNIAGSSIYEGGTQSLSFLGISLDTEGTLTFDSSELSSALNDDPDLVKNLLQASKVGFANYFDTVLKEYTSYSTGRMDVSTQAIEDKIELYNDQITRYEERATAREAVLRKQFTALETIMSESQSLSTLLSQQLGSN